MKFWNKKHEVQRRCWHKVKLRPIFNDDIKVWCQQQASTGKFYGRILQSDIIYVEKSEDALLITLKWG